MNEKLKIEIKESKKYLDMLKKDHPDSYDISDELWNFSTEILRKIASTFKDLYDKDIPIPYFQFITDESEIDIDWDLKGFKLILAFYDHLEQDAIVYSKKKGEEAKSLVFKRNEIVDIAVRELYENGD